MPSPVGIARTLGASIGGLSSTLNWRTTSEVRSSIKWRCSSEGFFEKPTISVKTIVAADITISSSLRLTIEPFTYSFRFPCQMFCGSPPQEVYYFTDQSCRASLKERKITALDSFVTALPTRPRRCRPSKLGAKVRTPHHRSARKHRRRLGLRQTRQLPVPWANSYRPQLDPRAPSPRV